MKLRFLTVFSITLAVIMVSFFALSSASSVEITGVASSTEQKVITVANSSDKNADAVKVLEARFLNLLNHNFVYGSDFDYVENIVNQSVIALLDMREDNSFISESIVADYVFDMYGIEISDFSEINSDFPSKEGYVYIIPRGYSIYEHEMISVTKNEDGSFTAKTKVTVSYHDGGEYTDFCETLFVENEKSALGFSIISADISVEELAI